MTENKMKVNNKNKLNSIISLLDTHIINELKKVEVNEDKVDTLSGIRTVFVMELNNVMRGENNRKMFDKDYWKTYRKSNQGF